MVPLPKLSEIIAASAHVVSIIIVALCHIIVLLIPLAGSSADQATHTQQNVGLANEQGGWSVVSLIGFLTLQ